MIERKTKMILVIAFLFFLSGLSFFYFRMSPQKEEEIYRKKEEIKADIILKNMPAPDNFENFVYKTGKILKIDEKCSDVFKTILIYDEKIDFRYDPLSAKYNIASKCVDGYFKNEINLDLLNLTEGNNYYLIKAEQGGNGSWYKPY